MTKVRTRLELVTPLTDEMMSAVSDAHSVYGIAMVRVEPTLDALTVEYDASRLNEVQVQEWLARIGLPVKRRESPVF